MDNKRSKNKRTLKQLHDKHLTCVSDGLTDNIHVCTHFYNSMSVEAFSENISIYTRKVHYLNQTCRALNSEINKTCTTIKGISVRYWLYFIQANINTYLHWLTSMREPILDVVNEICWSPITISSSCKLKKRRLVLTCLID